MSIFKNEFFLGVLCQLFSYLRKGVRRVGANLGKDVWQRGERRAVDAKEAQGAVVKIVTQLKIEFAQVVDFYNRAVEDFGA